MCTGVKFGRSQVTKMEVYENGGFQTRSRNFEVKNLSFHEFEMVTMNTMQPNNIHSKTRTIGLMALKF